MKPPLFAAALALALAACANPYRANFNSTLDRMPDWTADRLAPPEVKPRVIKSDNIREDNWKMFERGYVMVGFVKFDGPPTNVELALAQAKAANADAVVVQEKFTRTLTETVAVTQWPADERTEVREEVMTTGRRGVNLERRTAEIRTTRDPETVYVPKDVDFYEHSATFWRRIEAPIFGALVQDLSDDLKMSLQTNRGLVVRAVMIDSPAFTADLLKGDIILAINGRPVSSSRRFYENLEQMGGQEIALTVRRGSANLDRKAVLNR